MSDNSDIEQIDQEFRLLAEKRKKLAEITRGLSNLEPEEEPEITSDIVEPTLEPQTKPAPEILTDSVVGPKNDTINSSKKEKSKEYDNDRLALSKNEIIDFCNRIIEKWNNDPTKDGRHVFAMNAVKTSVIWTDEETLKAIWKEIFSWAFEILYKNAIAQAKGENMKWSQILDQINKS